MSTIRISAKGIDELNAVYRKLKKEYQATESIRLNQQTMEYELILCKTELEKSLATICDKVIDADELLEEQSVFEDFTWIRLGAMMQQGDTPLPFRPLQMVWKKLSEEQQRGCYAYLCCEKQITPQFNIPAQAVV